MTEELTSNDGTAVDTFVDAPVDQFQGGPVHPRSYAADLPVTGAWRPGDPVGGRQFTSVGGGRPLVLESGEALVDIEMAYETCLLYTSPSPRDATLSRMPSSA